MKDLELKSDVKGGTDHPSGFGYANHGQQKGHGWTGYRSAEGTTFWRSGVFGVIIGQIVTAAVGVAIYFISYGSEKATNKADHDSLMDRVAKVEAIQKRMDESGTNFSHYGIASEKDAIVNLERRVTTNEDSVKKIDVMDSKITRIDATVNRLDQKIK